MTAVKVAMDVSNILLVDDRPENLVALEGALEHLGQNLVKASSGKEALKHLLHEDFALILMDVQMPGMDGFETAEMIRAREKSRHIPIVFVTAINKSNVHVFRGYSLGAVDYLIKPVDPGVLRAKVSAFVGMTQEEQKLKAEVERREREEEGLRRTRDDLERRVRERTAQLETANRELHREIQEREVLEQDLQERAEVLEAQAGALAEADRRKDEFLAMLAHELRNPLAAVMSAVWVLEHSVVPDPALQRHHEVIARQSRHLTRLVDDLLDVSRITRGTIDLRKKKIELAQVLAHAVEACAPLIDARDHCLNVDLPEGAIYLEADPVRLQQVVSNLLNNAAKYTPPGGQIRLSARPERETVAISVQDNGAGIAPEMLDKVFDLFVQAEPSIDRAEAGLGIGLTLVQKLVALHEGSVEARSAGRGRGSEFRVCLPRLQGNGASVADSVDEPATPADGGGGLVKADLPRVMIIEDMPDAADSLQLMLQLIGHSVAVAYNGSEGIEMALRFGPDVVLCDIGLPGMDGYAVARRLRQEPALEGIRLVALTGYGQEQDRHLTRDAGFDLHLVKPVDPAELERLLAEVPCRAR